MRYRSGLSFAVLFVAACSVGVDSPVTPNISPAFDVEEGVKPPPPLGSGDAEITLFSPSSETPSEFLDGGPSASVLGNLSFFATLSGRYFSNSQFTNGWIQFDSDDCVIATPDARLQYNENTGRTTGHGKLTHCDGAVLDLSKIVITEGGFGDCEFDFDDEEYSCRSFSFSYNGIPGGSVFVGPGD